MLRVIGLTLLLAFAWGTTAQAAEGCGKNEWRDEYGHCHWFNNASGNQRGTTHACPSSAHWQNGRCVPN